jgi:hypothetical protein
MLTVIMQSRQATTADDSHPSMSMFDVLIGSREVRDQAVVGENDETPRAAVCSRERDRATEHLRRVVAM